MDLVSIPFLDIFFSDSLYNAKIFLVSSILTIIFFLLLLTRKIYKKKLTISNLSIYSSLFLLLITLSSLLVVNFFGKFTYVLFIAATITVIYFVHFTRFSYGFDKGFCNSIQANTHCEAKQCSG